MLEVIVLQVKLTFLLAYPLFLIHPTFLPLVRYLFNVVERDEVSMVVDGILRRSLLIPIIQEASQLLNSRRLLLLVLHLCVGSV